MAAERRREEKRRLDAYLDRERRSNEARREAEAAARAEAEALEAEQTRPVTHAELRGLNLTQLAAFRKKLLPVWSRAPERLGAFDKDDLISTLLEILKRPTTDRRRARTHFDHVMQV